MQDFAFILNSSGCFCIAVLFVLQEFELLVSFVNFRSPLQIARLLGTLHLYGAGFNDVVFLKDEALCESV